MEAIQATKTQKAKIPWGGGTQEAKNPAPEARTVQGIDPYEVASKAGGEARLEQMLQNSDISQIRAMIKEYQLDPLRITAGWKRKDRIIAQIMEVVYGRVRDGAALRRN